MAILDQAITDRYALYCGDCMEVMPNLPDGAIHFSVYSPPFAGLYQYSSSEHDLSNSRDYDEFMTHYEYVVREIHRLTMPGRMTAVHCMDVPRSNNGRSDSFMDFPGDIIRLHERNGWAYVARYHVWKEPLAVRNRTMKKGLAHQTIVEDSSRCSVAAADYLLVFRRDGDNPVPVAHPNGLKSYAGARQMPADVLKYKDWDGLQIENRFSHWIWRQYASAFWDDVRLDRVLPFRESRDEEDEKHVHPLQLDVIERAVVLWTNPGERVLTPFMGVGSEVYVPVQLARFGIGVELKPSYFRQAVKNMQAVDDDTYSDMPLFHQPSADTDDEGEFVLELA